MNDPYVVNVYQPPTPTARNIGYGGMLQQWYESNYDATSGYTNRIEYKGQDWNYAVALQNYFTNLGISANLKNEHGMSTLTLTDATGNYVIDKWELSVDREQPDMFENPQFLELMQNASYPSFCISMLRQALKNSNAIDFNVTTDSGWYALVRMHTPNPTTTTANPPVTTYGTPNINANAVSFINALGIGFTGNYPGDDSQGGTMEWTAAYMVKLKQYFDSYSLGVTNFMRGKYKLRHTSNIPARWKSSVADFNVEKIYTIPQFVAEITGSNWIIPCPTYMVYKISNFIPDSVAAWTPWYVWGALKEKSDAVSAANNRVELVTEYLIDNISTLLYPTV